MCNDQLGETSQTDEHFHLLGLILGKDPLNPSGRTIRPPDSVCGCMGEGSSLPFPKFSIVAFSAVGWSNLSNF